MTSAPVPFNEATRQYDSYDHIVPSSALGGVDPIDATLTVQQGSGALLAHQPEQGISGNHAAATPHTIGTTAQTMQSANAQATVPAIIRRTIGTPALISSVDRRRVRPRKYGCHICSSMLTSKENRDRELPLASASAAL